MASLADRLSVMGDASLRSGINSVASTGLEIRSFSYCINRSTISSSMVVRFHFACVNISNSF